MDIEFHQLDRRYEALRRASPEREKRVLASLARVGQQLPVVVVIAADRPERYVLVDGYKRVRCLLRLREDLVRATTWTLPEPDALLLERLMRTQSEDGPLEQGWLLCELRDRFQLSLEELARRFDKSASWISGRLALAAQLPGEIQAHVRAGSISAHAAMKFLVPLARANADDCLQLARAIAPLRPSTRQTEALATAFTGGSAATRALILGDPALFLRAREASRAPAEKDPAALILSDLGALGGIARRLHRRLGDGAARRLVDPEQDDLRRCFGQTKADVEQLFVRWAKELP